MAVNLNDIANKTMKLFQGNGHQMKMFDANSGKSVASPEEARFFYVKEPNMMVHIDGATNELKFHIGEDVDIDNPKINNMMNQLKSLARTNMLDFDIRSFGKHIEPKNYAYKVKQNQEQTMTDHVNEGMGPLSGSSKTSRQTLENVRLILKHRAPVNEESRGSRSRNISAIFVETGEGERFKYPFIHLNGARAMARHIASGGETHDIVGEAIVEMSSNLAQLKEFTKIVDKQQLVNENNRKVVLNVRRSMNSIKETIQRIQSARGYAKFVEGIALKGEKTNAEISEETLDSYVQKFTKSSFEESLKDILPLVHRVNEEEMTDRRENQTERVKEIMTATVKKTGERVNTITFGEPSNPSYDYTQIKKQFAEPRTPEEAAEQKISKIALTFDGLADTVTVDTLNDKGPKKKGHDLAAEISFFLTDIADAIRSNPRGIAKDDMQVAGQLLKMSKASVETVEPKSADTRISEMLEEAFSKFDSDKVIEKKNEIDEDDAELKYSMKKPTLDDLIQMSNEADYEMGDAVVFSMKNHPAYRFDLQSELKDYMERVRVGSTHAETDHSGYLNMKVSEIADNIDGMAIVAVEDGNKIKAMVGWSSEDEIYPPQMIDKPSGKDEDGEFASGPDDDQVRIRHLAGVDDF
ncbi:MAG: hypothetical protein H8D95_01630 [Candidatus Endolissoclinum sp.]|nr:hypothetical protein [Candidatus Endolissoclinum sp.]